MPTNDAPGLVIHDITAPESQDQLIVLGLLLQDQGFNAGIVRPNYFPDPIVEKIVETILAYIRQYGASPTVDTLQSLLVDTFRPEDDSMEYPTEILSMALETLQNVPVLPETDLVYYRQRAVTFVRAQRLELALRQKDALVKAGELNRFAELVSEAVGVSDSASTEIVSFLDNSWCDKILERRESAIRTMFPTLDAYIDGLGPGELCVVVAPTSGGKTRFLLSLAHAATQQHQDALFLSVEMASWKLCMRLAMRVLQMGKNYVTEHVDELKQRLEELRGSVDSTVYFAQFSPGVATVDDLRAFYAEYLKTHRKPGLILVDYADKLAPVHKSERNYLDIEQIYKSLIAWSRECEVPVCTASQTNREGMDRTLITLKYIDASISKAAISDIILTLTIDEDDPTITRCYLAKNRDGVAGKQITLKIDPETQNLVEY